MSGSRLVEDWCSRAAAKQRGGRAGRTAPGVVVRTYCREVYQHRMLAQPVPELRRVPLENLCLEIKSTGLQEQGAFAAQIHVLCPRRPLSSLFRLLLRLLPQPFSDLADHSCFHCSSAVVRAGL